MQNVGYSWPARIGAAVITWFILSFVISQLCAAYVLGRAHWRIHRNPPNEVADKIAAAIKGLPPEEQEAVAKRMIDDMFRASH
jgi:hypothetical protein